MRLYLILNHSKVVLYFEDVALATLKVKRAIIIDRHHQLIEWALFVAFVSDRIKDRILQNFDCRWSKVWVYLD